VALLHEPTRTLLTGDAVFGGRSPSTGPTPMALDPQGARDSLARLPTDVDAVGFAHGAPLLGRAVVAYQRMHSTGGSR
jgi:glyoxylase-like metal-dependent hydrolase (beta-lactamase superfamily II)